MAGTPGALSGCRRSRLSPPGAAAAGAGLGQRAQRPAARPAAPSRPAPGAAAGRSPRSPQETSRGREQSCFFLQLLLFSALYLAFGGTGLAPAGEPVATESGSGSCPTPAGPSPPRDGTPGPVPCTRRRDCESLGFASFCFWGCQGQRDRAGPPAAADGQLCSGSPKLAVAAEAAARAGPSLPAARGSLTPAMGALVAGPALVLGVRVGEQLLAVLLAGHGCPYSPTLRGRIQECNHHLGFKLPAT